MRYIRFLKTPRIVTDKTTATPHISCLITITSDLGDSFFPHDAELVAELLDCKDERILVWRTVAWAAGMRTLAVTLPLKKSYASIPLRLRIGTEHNVSFDTFQHFSQTDSQGIVSAWSAEFNAHGVKEAIKLVERRFSIAQSILRIWEETGESIARHLWDAGITLSCHMADVQSGTTPLSTLLPLSPHRTQPLTVLELGTGCGIVGMTLALTIPNCTVHLSDLPEARDIVERNMTDPSLRLAPGSSLAFTELDWDNELPAWLTHPNSKTDLVLAADCTYNPDSSPLLVNTLRKLADLNSEIVVGIAMKMRHESEVVFFDRMAEAGFRETGVVEYLLPGDLETGEEKVDVHVYRHGD